MNNEMLRLVTVLLVAFSLHAAVAAGSNRLREWDLKISTTNLRDTPMVDPPKRIAGYFSLNRTKAAEMFYFFFESRSQKADDPVVLWMTGGPGCSSELAIFYENGPYTVTDDLTLEETKYGWDVNSNMIFVDQPINTGFSYSDDPKDTVHDEYGVAEDMLDFLQEFFEAHPEFSKRDFFVTGESYAGHYVPAVSHRVWLAKKAWEGEPINLKGLAIGNGLTDPGIQYGAYADYALDNDLITQALHDKIQRAVPICQKGIQLCNGHGWKPECVAALTYCQSAVFERILAANPNINYYDIRKDCTGHLCYDFSNAEKFLNLESTRKTLGVGDIKWQSCSPSVYMDMMGDWMKNYDTLLPAMLEDGMRIMIYAGEEDLICNWLGNRRWVDALDWTGANGWADAKDFNWTSNGEPAGEVREYDVLTFVKVFGAGHMVPMDQPSASLDMITKFTRGKSFKPPSTRRYQAASTAELKQRWEGMRQRLNQKYQNFVQQEVADS